MSYLRSMTWVIALAAATLVVSCAPPKNQSESGEADSVRAQTPQPHTNGLSPDQFLAEFGAMGYTIDTPWSDSGDNKWTAAAHKTYDGGNNVVNLVLASNIQSRVDRIELSAAVVYGSKTPQMHEAIETGVRTCFAGMELRTPAIVEEAFKNRSTFAGEAGRFKVYIHYITNTHGGYIQTLQMTSP